jgi:hypothetical protein
LTARHGLPGCHEADLSSAVSGDPHEQPKANQAHPGGAREPKIPATVVTALALAALVGVVDLLVGSLVLALAAIGTLPHNPDVPAPMILTVAWTYLVLGCVTVLAAVGLSGRRHRSRVVLTVVMTVGMTLASLSSGLIGTWCSTASLIGIPLSWVAITLLWDSRANEYFHANR